MKHLLLCMLLLTATSAMAQRRISGTVSDDFDVIPGANVVEIDKNNRIVQGTVTDMNGNFTMQIKSDKDHLRITFLGLQDFNEVIGNRSVFKVKLKENTRQMQEVVKTAKRMSVSGGLAIPQREMTGASQSFSMEEMEGLAFQSVDQALQGQIAGLDIVANSGNLGAGTTMRIRGTATFNGDATPLIVVDDHEFTIPEEAQGNLNFENMDNEEMFSSLLNVNVEDIESITVLKDASSAAKWGDKAANGVIEIKLKKGRRGPTHVNFTYNFQGTWFNEGYRLLDGDSYTMMLKEAYYNPKRRAVSYNEIDYNTNYPDIFYNYNKNTDWVGAVTRLGQNHSYSVNLSGGGEKATFRVSAAYKPYKGYIIGQSMDQFTSQTNLEYNVSDRIKFTSSMMLSFVTKENCTNNPVFGKAQKAMPNMSIYEYDSNGDRTGHYFTPLAPYGTTEYTNVVFQDMWNNGNPVQYAHAIKRKDYQYNLTPQFDVTYKLLGKDNEHTQLNYTGDVQLQIFNTSNDQYTPAELANLAWQYYDTNSYTGGGWSVKNTRNILSNSEFTSLQFYTRHELKFYPHFNNEDHFLAAQARFDMMDRTSTSQSINLWNAPVGISDPTVKALMTGTSVSNSHARDQHFFFNVHYSYKSKYVISGAVNITGSTAYGSGNKYATFPSISARWNIIDEKFMKWAKPVLSMFSISPDWGVKGQSVGGSYLQYNKYSAGSNYIGNSTIYPANLSLHNVKWQKTVEWNIRSNLGFFNDLITMDFDVYDKKTTDMLMYSYAIPSSNGFSSLAAVNTGQMRNKGWELYLNTGKICKIGKFSMKLKANISQNFNKIDEMDELILANLNGTDRITLANNNYDALKRVQVGNALGSIYGLRYKGVYRYDYAHNGYTKESQNNYGSSSNGYDKFGNPINTYKAALQRGEKATCPIAYDKNGNMLTDKYGNPMQMYMEYQYGARYKFEGGDAIYEDINHDGQIDQYDVVYLGNCWPTVSGGFGITLFWGRFTLQANFNYRMGNKIVNAARSGLEAMYTNDNQSYATTWRWRRNGDETTMPRALHGSEMVSYNSLPSDRYVEDGDYLRFNYLQLAYDFDSKLIKKWGLNQLKLSASLQNICVWSKYNGIDPDVSPGGYGLAIDNAKTPRMPQFTFNLNLGF